jgi:hypothetical protein
MEITFIKYLRSDAARTLHRKPLANHLLSIIANRVRFKPDLVENLKTGQCRIGAKDNHGLTRQQYRTAISNLKKWGIIETKTTNLGTIVTLISSDIYDINGNSQPSKQPPSQPKSNHPANHSATNEQPLNKKEKKDKKEKKVKKTYSDEFTEFWKVYPGHRRGDKAKAYEEWKKIDSDLYPQIISHVESRINSDPQWIKDQGKFIVHACRFLSGCRWEDGWIPCNGLSDQTNQNVQNMQAFIEEARNGRH